MIAGAALALAAAAPDEAAATLARYTAGKRALAPVTCIEPDRTAHPEVVDGQGILYFRGGVTYFARFEHGGCPQLRADRTFLTSPLGGQLCRHDEVRVVEAGGGTGYGFCTFDAFVPYVKAG